MIELFFGTDYDTIHSAIEKIVHTYEGQGFSKKNVSGEEYGEEEMLEMLLGEDLFSSRQIIVVSGILKFPSVVEVLCAWQEGDHPTKKIIWRESTVLATDKKIFKKAGIVLQEYKKTSIKDNRIFQLTDQLANRNTKQFWMSYQTLLQDGVSAHHMIGLLWWQMKTMILVAQSKENPGLAPFVYTKTKKAIQNYTPQELHEKAKMLVALYHRGHAGDAIEILLEKFILSI